jgi:hypothetical protein
MPDLTPKHFPNTFAILKAFPRFDNQVKSYLRLVISVLEIGVKTLAAKSQVPSKLLMPSVEEVDALVLTEDKWAKEFADPVGVERELRDILVFGFIGMRGSALVDPWFEEFGREGRYGVRHDSVGYRLLFEGMKRAVK